MSTFSQTKTLVNVDRGGLALQGYDHVAFCTHSCPVKDSAGSVVLALKALPVVNGRQLTEYDWV
jgi:hypothetical protein